MKSGFVSIVGCPNVGKSTLLNALINKKIAITSNKVGTTRNIIYGIYNEEDIQIVFVDTPGIQKANNKLEVNLNSKSYASFKNDIVLFLIDAEKGFGKNDKKILDQLKNANKKVILVINKIDGMKNDDIFKMILSVKDEYDFLEVVPISSLKKLNIVELIKVIKEYLPDSVKYYNDDELTNVSESFMAAEIIREKVLRLTREEVPHTVTCLVENMEFKKDTVVIEALIIVERDNLKAIIIGKKGSMLSKIGEYARKDLEELFGKKVYLSLLVKVIDNWRQKDGLFEYLNLDDLDS